MDFAALAFKRNSCRCYDINKDVEMEKLLSILEAGRLAPSACNGQPYHITVCQGEKAKAIARATTSMGMNAFASQAPVMLVISEEDYIASAALGARIKKNDYRSMDIGILAAYLTAQASDLGLGSCMLGWFDDEKIRSLCGLTHPVRLVISLGYPGDENGMRMKKRRDMDAVVSWEK